MLFFVCLLPQPATSDCALAQQLEERIASYFAYPPSGTCPDITITDLSRASQGQRFEAGAYFPQTDRIVLDERLDLTTALGQSYLLHELVHAAQNRAGRAALVACRAEMEGEAYRAQARFLRESGDNRAANAITRIGRKVGTCSQARSFDY
ncbi:DUF6647 family protein [Aestuariibius sp. 2305UL40-4]|uniref:DUF6647 family protein n=1 Tax=Aestuariibius violaceus TaxID=3234132 RepID=UPI00345ED12A